MTILPGVILTDTKTMAFQPYIIIIHPPPPSYGAKFIWAAFTMS